MIVSLVVRRRHVEGYQISKLNGPLLISVFTLCKGYLQTSTSGCNDLWCTALYISYEAPINRSIRQPKYLVLTPTYTEQNLHYRALHPYTPAPTPSIPPYTAHALLNSLP